MTDEELDEFEKRLDAHDRAVAEIERRSRAMVDGMRLHYQRRDANVPPAEAGGTSSS